MKNGNLDNEARISPICFDFFARFRSIGFKLIIKPAIYFVFLSRSIYLGRFDLDHGCFVPEPIGDGKRQRFSSYLSTGMYIWITSRQGPLAVRIPAPVDGKMCQNSTGLDPWFH